MKYLSVCAGIEAASVAWHQFGWEPVAFSEIEPFPCAVLAHHYPNVPNWGDMTKFKEWPDATINVLVGGTPCQSFSVAGLREGLADSRGNLMLTYLGIAQKYRPEWLVWENVPGVLSSNGGEDFATLLRGMAELGYGVAYRILDAQFFGVAQRRRRVFVVGNSRDWRRAAAVLFERHSLSGDSAPRRKTGKVTPAISASGTGVSRTGFNSETGFYIPTDTDVAKTLITGIKYDSEVDTFVTQSDNVAEVFPTLGCEMAVAMRESGQGYWMRDEVAETLKAEGEDRPSRPSHVIQQTAMQVRRLTGKECERLQGFPDDYTAITYKKKPASDGPRYKALGNSMAVPVMAWIGKRIQTLIDELP